MTGAVQADAASDGRMAHNARRAGDQRRACAPARPRWGYLGVDSERARADDAPPDTGMGATRRYRLRGGPGRRPRGLQALRYPPLRCGVTGRAQRELRWIRARPGRGLTAPAATSTGAVRLRSRGAGLEAVGGEGRAGGLGAAAHRQLDAVGTTPQPPRSQRQPPGAPSRDLLGREAASDGRFVAAMGSRDGLQRSSTERGLPIFTSRP